MVDLLGLWAAFVIDGAALATRFPSVDVAALIDGDEAVPAASAEEHDFGGSARRDRLDMVRSWPASSSLLLLLGGKETVRRGSCVLLSWSSELAFLLRDALAAGSSTTRDVFADASR